MEINFNLLPDPDGSKPGLLLTGDWLFVFISDGQFTGVGEASHAGDDRRCMKKMRDLFNRYMDKSHITLDFIRALEAGPFAEAEDFLEATAISGLNQALYELVARREGVPVWQLFVNQPHQSRLSFYTTINRALKARDYLDYAGVLDQAAARGFQQVKCAPFEKVTPDCNQVLAATGGLHLLARLREKFPNLSMRVDCHKRFTCENFLSILPVLNSLDLHWIEEPCEFEDGYREIRTQVSCQLAGGELYYGAAPFVGLMRKGFVDVIMPDVKHVGGFGPMVQVVKKAGEYGLEISPHNPSGPVSTLASLHACALSKQVTSLEIPFGLSSNAVVSKFFDGGYLCLPEQPGWGVDISEFLNADILGTPSRR